MSVPGYAFAIVTWPLGSWQVLIAGLWAPLATTCMVFVVSSVEFDPNAPATLTLYLVLFLLVWMPLSFTAWKRILRHAAFPSKLRILTTRPIQYSLKSLLMLMTSLAIILATLRLVVLATPYELYPRIAALNLVLSGILIYWFDIFDPSAQVIGPCTKT
jgi:hypothetical protein